MLNQYIDALDELELAIAANADGLSLHDAYLLGKEKATTRYQDALREALGSLSLLPYFQPNSFLEIDNKRRALVPIEDIQVISKAIVAITSLLEAK